MKLTLLVIIKSLQLAHQILNVHEPFPYLGTEHFDSRVNQGSDLIETTVNL